MNAIIYPIKASMKQNDDFVVICWNYSIDYIHYSRQELQLQYRIQEAQRILQHQIFCEQQTKELELKLLDQQITNQQSIQQQVYLNLVEMQQFSIDLNSTSIQVDDYQIEDNFEVKCSTPKFEDIARQPLININRIQTKRKSKKQQQFFSFEKKDQQLKFQKRLSVQSIYQTQQDSHKFVVSVPEVNQSYQTSFQQLGLMGENYTIKDFKKAILTYQSQSIKVYQQNPQCFIELNDDQKLSDLIIVDNTEFKFMDVASDLVQDILILQFKYGRIEFLKSDYNYVQYCKFSQDCVEIDEEVINFVERITFYNFGQSIKTALIAKLENFEKFKKWVQEWCEINQFQILYLGKHLTVKLI